MVSDLRTIVPNVVWCSRTWCLKQLYFCYSLLFETFVYIQPVYCFKRCVPAGAVLLCQRCGRCFKHCSWRISACCLKRYPAFQDVAFQTLFICSSLFCCSVVWNVVFVLICMLFQTFFFPAFWNGAESSSGMFFPGMALLPLDSPAGWKPLVDRRLAAQDTSGLSFQKAKRAFEGCP